MSVSYTLLKKEAGLCECIDYSGELDPKGVRDERTDLLAETEFEKQFGKEEKDRAVADALAEKKGNK